MLQVLKTFECQYEISNGNFHAMKLFYTQNLLTYHTKLHFCHVCKGAWETPMESISHVLGQVLLSTWVPYCLKAILKPPCKPNATEKKEA